MKKFFLLTRGRTGSTAVLDALDKTPSVLAIQEPFLRSESDWRLSIESHQLPYYDQYFESNSLLRRAFARGQLLDNYLNLLEQHAAATSNSAFGFKVLSHHFANYPGLLKRLNERGYSCLFLRRDLSAQVISGMVAAIRQRYNSIDNPPPSASLRLDPGKFKDLLLGEILRTEEDEQTIANWKHGILPIFYENFVANPGQFFKEICGFLEVPIVDTPETSYKKMIGDIGKEIENLDELQEIASRYTDEEGRYVFRRD